MIQYGEIGQSNYNAVAFNVMSDSPDSTDKTVSVNLSKNPFNIPFLDVLPAAIQVIVQDDTITATATITNGVDGSMMAVTFSDVPPSDSMLGFTAQFLYASL